MDEANDRQIFNQLIASLSAVFEQEGRPGGSAASIDLQRALSKPYRRAVSKADPGAVLDRACQLEGALPLASQVRSVFSRPARVFQGDTASARLFQPDL